ncbi:hypothetical protein BZG36_00303 [Bifiguratus adelaidae]|uniref:HMG box domain-containing protein n=1 Tax=Bifiguratus adelaidae TaxID=1938954 RepID=A0A261Y7Y0_9FUNG|nr:hypothetical protein BZG36_00303 [Bifiguratus adelaidae]
MTSTLPHEHANAPSTEGYMTQETPIVHSQASYDKSPRPHPSLREDPSMHSRTPSNGSMGMANGHDHKPMASPASPTRRPLLPSPRADFAHVPSSNAYYQRSYPQSQAQSHAHSHPKHVHNILPYPSPSHRLYSESSHHHHPSSMAPRDPSGTWHPSPPTSTPSYNYSGSQLPPLNSAYTSHHQRRPSGHGPSPSSPTKHHMTSPLIEGRRPAYHTGPPSGPPNGQAPSEYHGHSGYPDARMNVYTPRSSAGSAPVQHSPRMEGDGAYRVNEHAHPPPGSRSPNKRPMASPRDEYRQAPYFMSPLSSSVPASYHDPYAHGYPEQANARHHLPLPHPNQSQHPYGQYPPQPPQPHKYHQSSLPPLQPSKPPPKHSQVPPAPRPLAQARPIAPSEPTSQVHHHASEETAPPPPPVPTKYAKRVKTDRKVPIAPLRRRISSAANKPIKTIKQEVDDDDDADMSDKSRGRSRDDDTETASASAKKKIPRPMNSFFAYRADTQLAIRRANPLLDNGEVSKIVAQMWRTESQEVKARYKVVAQKLSQEHKQMYPDYKYCPKKHSKKRGRKGRLEYDANGIPIEFSEDMSPGASGTPGEQRPIRARTESQTGEEEEIDELDEDDEDMDSEMYREESAPRDAGSVSSPSTPGARSVPPPPQAHTKPEASPVRQKRKYTKRAKTVAHVSSSQLESPPTSMDDEPEDAPAEPFEAPEPPMPTIGAQLKKVKASDAPPPVDETSTYSISYYKTATKPMADSQNASFHLYHPSFSYANGTPLRSTHVRTSESRARGRPKREPAHTAGRLRQIAPIPDDAGDHAPNSTEEHSYPHSSASSEVALVTDEEDDAGHHPPVVIPTFGEPVRAKTLTSGAALYLEKYGLLGKPSEQKCVEASADGGVQEATDKEVKPIESPPASSKSPKIQAEKQATTEERATSPIPSYPPSKRIAARDAAMHPLKDVSNQDQVTPVASRMHEEHTPLPSGLTPMAQPLTS